MDRLDALLQGFAVRAEMFHSGPLCGLTDFADSLGRGQLHLVKRGAVEAWHLGRREHITQPSLLFYPRGLSHRLISDNVLGADMACANVQFEADDRHPIAQSLPPVVILPLHELVGADSLLEVLFDEAFHPRCGGRQLVNRLFESVLILIFRSLLEQGRVSDGMLAGLADPRLSRALVALHDEPARAWSLARLAASAGLSRTRFAYRFREVVGCTPGEYLTRHRMRIAQSLLMQGRTTEQVAASIGYSGQSAFSRAFSEHLGRSPRAWLREKVVATSPPAVNQGTVSS